MSAKKRTPSWKTRALYAEKMMRDQGEASVGLMEANQKLRKELEIGNNAALAQANTLEEHIRREQERRKEFVKMTNATQDLAEKLAKAEERVKELEHEAQKDRREIEWWMEASDEYRWKLIEIARDREPKPESEELKRVRRELLGQPDDPEQAVESK